jgi:hypothetical protein
MSTSRYTVRKLGWYQPPHGDPYTRRLPVVDFVATFGTFDEAEDRRRELEADARDGENPFRFGGASVFFQSSLDGPRLHDWLLDAGIDPPASELRHSDWRAWWDAFAHTWNPDQLAHAWAAFDKVRFFEVVPAPPFIAHVTVTIVEDRSRTPAPRTERGRLVRISRRPTIAPVRQAVRRRPPNRSEVLAVPSDVPMFAGTGFLVQRRVVLTATYPGERNESPVDTRVPLALFADRAAAGAHRTELAAEGRRTLNPFVFVEPADGAATDEGRAALNRLGLSLPVPDHDRRVEWLEWYDLCQGEVTDEQLATVWERCDRPLFEVLCVEVADG